MIVLEECKEKVGLSRFTASINNSIKGRSVNDFSFGLTDNDSEYSYVIRTVKKYSNVKASIRVFQNGIEVTSELKSGELPFSIDNRVFEILQNKYGIGRNLLMLVSKLENKLINKADSDSIIHDTLMSLTKSIEKNLDFAHRDNFLVIDNSVSKMALITGKDGVLARLKSKALKSLTSLKQSVDEFFFEDETEEGINPRILKVLDSQGEVLMVVKMNQK